MTTFNDGPLIRQSIESILHQTHGDLELVLVDDGSGAETKDIIREFDDSRLIVLPQSNDGLSSARNRALQHASGDYISFLDADDVRSPWAFSEASDQIEKTGAELLLVGGFYSAERTSLSPFFDEDSFLQYEREIYGEGADSLATRKAWAASMEPQCANKFVSRSLVERGNLRFPNDHFFEDILFHTMCVSHARSIHISKSKSFTYFQRQLRSQLTSSNNQIRFDILGTARVTWQLFQSHPDFSDSRQRGAISIGVLRLLRWCEDCLPSYHKHAFRVALREVFRSVAPVLLHIDETAPDPRRERESLTRYVREVMA